MPTTSPTTPTLWSPRRLSRQLMARRRPWSHSPCPMVVSTTTAMATTDTPLSRLSLARPLSPPSTTMARGLLKLSLLPMLMPKLTLGWPTDPTAMVMDSTGHTDTAATGVDIPMAATDMVPTDTTDKDTASKFLPRYYPNVFRESISQS